MVALLMLALTMCSTFGISDWLAEGRGVDADDSGTPAGVDVGVSLAGALPLAVDQPIRRIN